MLHTNNRPAPSKNEQMSILQYHGSNIAVERINGVLMFNATQMAKPFGKNKRPKEWLRTLQAKELINAVSEGHICPSADIVQVRHGGLNQGTWFQEDIALFFAQWLSPKFYLACNRKLKEIVNSEVLNVEPKNGVYPILIEGQWLYPYTEVLRSLDASTRSSASRRKAKFPKHFKKAFGRNFITGHLFDVLKSFYDYKNAQLTLNFDA
ncbi:KilA-N domain-containing protein [Riemerella anatipestifer]|nr:KilA-N domain-containing protein [Riemerella anatipestifer]MDY3534237.1 KilA-N domain-containing protein [Riemerella anatipestifer]MDY3536295.1 KilA-N domain-containing protein [Riemerella anatipestifer]